jgi:hypothetical protein
MTGRTNTASDGPKRGELVPGRGDSTVTVTAQDVAGSFLAGAMWATVRGTDAATGESVKVGGARWAIADAVNQAMASGEVTLRNLPEGHAPVDAPFDVRVLERWRAL